MITNVPTALYPSSPRIPRPAPAFKQTMARGLTTHTSSPTAVALPRVEFEIAKDEVFKLPAGVFDQQARTYGYNDFSEFRRPEHYIRHVELLESDLAKTVEYDMDEQDQEWLDVVNTDRRKDQIDKVSCEVFEIIMDRLEKEWFDLTKNIPKLDFAMPSEDSTCAICDDSEGENSNAIVFCDGCNLAVHQDCYGVPYIPEGQWLCRKCTVSPENPVSCALCPNEGGAFKQSLDGIWVHLLCAIWIPETRVANEVFMEPVTGLERISKGRWKLRCEICGIKNAGACIQCTKPSCFVAFHTTCARKEKLLMPMKSAQGAEPASLTAYCDRHLPPEQQEVRSAALDAEETTHSTNNLNSTKSARAYAKTYQPGPPLVPAIIVDRILAYTGRIKIRKKSEFVHQMCRYWSLKREARRGAPLLKRLHLEPWTASGGGKSLSEEEKLMQLDQLKRLRQDLLVLKDITDLVRKRETRKLRQAEVIYETMAQALFPHHGPLRHVFEKIMVLDRHDHFKNPVSRHDVPDYFDVIKRPMCWDVIDAKLDHHQYWDLQNFLDDVDLVLDNATLYNKDGSVFFKAAQRIKKDSRNIMSNLEKLRIHHDLALCPPNGELSISDVGQDRVTSDHTQEQGCAENEHPNLPMIGDLEPDFDSLELLVSSGPIREDLNIDLDNSAPIASLFSYEFAKVKPQPPDSPLSNRGGSTAGSSRFGISGRRGGKKGKQKRDRKAEIERARLNKEAREAAARAAASVGSESLTEGEDEALQTEISGRRKGKQKESGVQATLNAPAPLDVEGHATEGGQLVNNKSKKRGSVVPVAQPVVPMIVSTVDAKESFSFFHAGWILPENQKRGGRAPLPSQQQQHTEQPPSKKKRKIEHGDANLAASEDSVGNLQARGGSVDMEVDFQADDTDRDAGDVRAMSQSVDRADAPHNVFTQPNGTVIIEKIDSPAIRKERSMRRKAEKQKQVGASLSASSGQKDDIAESEPGPSSSQDNPMEEMEGYKKAQALDGFDDESELSELSEDESESDEEEIQEEPSSPRENDKKQPKKPPRKQSSKAEQFENSTIVWAKSESFPWWPAVVYSETNKQVPRNILETYKQVKARRKIKLYIVQYYDKQNSWQNVPRDKLRLLGEDEALDGQMLTGQKWKSSAIRKDCRDAYRQALAAIDMEVL